jgi:hypothetical protein
MNDNRSLIQIVKTIDTVIINNSLALSEKDENIE